MDTKIIAEFLVSIVTLVFPIQEDSRPFIWQRHLVVDHEIRVGEAEPFHYIVYERYSRTRTYLVTEEQAQVIKGLKPWEIWSGRIYSYSKFYGDRHRVWWVPDTDAPEIREDEYSAFMRRGE